MMPIDRVRAMRPSTLLIWGSLALVPLPAVAQTGSVNGTVVSAVSGQPLDGANVWVVDTNRSALTDAQGRFAISGVPAGPQRVKITRIGYAALVRDVVVGVGETLGLTFGMGTRAIALDAITVSGSRRAERITDAPVSVSLVSSPEIARSTAISYAESLQKTRGVDTYRTGIDDIVVNSRGFTTAFNYRFRVLVDNMNAHLPGGGIPAGGAFPVAKEDIDRMEAVLGPSSALYGPNAHNGLLHIITKDPRDYPGTTLVTGGGENSIWYGRLRRAAAFERFAYKINAEYLTGNNWVKNDTVAVDDAGRAYLEGTSDDVEQLRTSASLYFFPTPDVSVVASAGYGRHSSLVTASVGRIQRTALEFDYQQIRLTSPHFFLQAYRTGNDLGESYSIENKVAALVAAANAGQPMSEAAAKERARFVDKGDRLNYEAQYSRDLRIGATEVRVVTGVQREENRPNTGGTILTEGRVELSDPVTGGLKLNQTGAYAQVEVEPGDHWKFVAAGRYDTHSRYDAQWSPRFGVVYRMRDRGAFRVTYNRAFQAPETIQLELLTQFGTIPGTAIPIVLRGNGQGFTMSDGSTLPALEPERNTTWEVGYKGLLLPGLFIDADLFHSRYEGFISSLTPITDPATGSWPVSMGGAAVSGFPEQFVLTYLNFGRVKMTGLDIGLNYQFNRRASLWANYSYVTLQDVEDPGNDFNGDGRFDELSLNAPENKLSLGVGIEDLATPGLYAAASARWVQAYDFVSGRHRATSGGRGTGAFQFKDRGPLGDFVSFDVNLSYQINPRTQFNLSATNLFDQGLRESVGSPQIRRLVLTEVKYTLR
jgi:outer membrane receptor protein involved in Fe transport